MKLRTPSLFASFTLAAALLPAVHSRSVAEESSVFHRPVRLQAEGKDIDVGAVWGHAGPCLADVDGDGLRDLVVGDYSGKFRVYRNIGSNQVPRYAALSYLKAGDVDAEVRIYCCIGSSPFFVDFDNDGVLDMISGSYDPGECYLFRGLGSGKYAARETIVDESGKPVLHHPDRKQDYASFGSWPVMVDWEGDGDLDLVIGTFGGTMVVRRNEGSREKPKFAVANLVVQADGKQLKLPAGNRSTAGHAAPAIIDWDQDGHWDILSGSNSGAVYFYRNVGQASAPRFAAAQVLIPEHQGIGYDELLEPGAAPVPGIRTQIAATDYNEDGKIDLLVGDFCTNISPRPDLTADERKTMHTLAQACDAATAAVCKTRENLQDEFDKRYPGEAIYSDQGENEWFKAYNEMCDSQTYKQLEARCEALEASRNKYLAKPTPSNVVDKWAACHGYVWLFLRK